VLLAMTSLLGCLFSSKPYVDLMQKVPIDASSFSYWAIDRMAEDEALWDIYRKFMDSPEAKQITDLGLARSSVLHSATAHYGSLTNTSIRIVKGNLSAGDVERRLGEHDYSKELFSKVGVWTPADHETMRLLTVQDGMIFMASGSYLHSCILVMNENDALSYYDDQNVKAVADRLPHGVLVRITKAGLDPQENYRDLVAYGKSYRKVDDEKLELTAIYMFQDNPSAGLAGDLVTDYLEAKDFSDIKLKHDGSFIRVNALIDISAFAKTVSF